MELPNLKLTFTIILTILISSTLAAALVWFVWPTVSIWERVGLTTAITLFIALGYIGSMLLIPIGKKPEGN